MKNSVLIPAIILAILVISWNAHIATAQTSCSGSSCLDQYVELTGIPGVTNTGSQPTAQYNLTTLFTNMFYLGIAIAGVLAVIMLMWGGVEYMTSEAVTSKENAKSRIWAAFLGLLLVLGSWIILYTINPQILNLNVSPDTSRLQSSGAQPCNPAVANCLGSDTVIPAPPGSENQNPTVIPGSTSLNNYALTYYVQQPSGCYSRVMRVYTQDQQSFCQADLQTQQSNGNLVTEGCTQNAFIQPAPSNVTLCSN